MYTCTQYVYMCNYEEFQWCIPFGFDVTYFNGSLVADTSNGVVLNIDILWRDESKPQKLFLADSMDYPLEGNTANCEAMLVASQRERLVKKISDNICWNNCYQYIPHIQCQDYVYINESIEILCRNYSTIWDMKMRYTKIMYCTVLRCATIKNKEKSCFPLCQTYKPTVIFN